MSDDLAAELRKKTKELSACKLKLKEALEYNERLRSSVGFEEIVKVNICYFAPPIFVSLGGFPFFGGAGKFFRGLIE